ncbi:uncharacterized protein LOC121975192 isoform X1 [Zingiber officinale]|nr:uncharacterized protein LOC121970096 isoform X1 [Zingiber officinale]XP_042376470.1 uncharacterized protein LOC121970096 isoform X1 [Zingiber officinale]XP_042376471.1 uncharacterized protein LOC121970096 isoform X1 [Zingiber officinale]XP_042382594.1 uncharacterized protein LOC121975192 isoform X1 [Zingiber officinale]XP_042382595.1 uncharacterized protein LOC121975192 isoform X1 [Zingiber officinale]XP_042382596.1 uncharacterized protein LOC121975192 isoform X1 [Zingiber officinale]
MYTAMQGLEVAYKKMAIAGGITPRSGFGPLLFKPSTVSIPIYQLWNTNSFNIGQTMIKSVLGSKLICASLRSNDHPRLSYGGDFDNEPFWKTMVKDIAWSLTSVAVFLAEQPSQIKYIEWPTFQSTLRTAMLTLVLVAVLIVALSSVDSCLSYILALLLRRAA